MEYFIWFSTTVELIGPNPHGKTTLSPCSSSKFTTMSPVSSPQAHTGRQEEEDKLGQEEEELELRQANQTTNLDGQCSRHSQILAKLLDQIQTQSDFDALVAMVLKHCEDNGLSTAIYYEALRRQEARSSGDMSSAGTSGSTRDKAVADKLPATPRELSPAPPAGSESYLRNVGTSTTMFSMFLSPTTWTTLVISKPLGTFVEV
ncbi:hypothetical protein IWX90DRAFT_192838 [Phyllosticta citrichinensis]|uniref:Uncharacterized protein n=1 Tax=Phyllosticta citrichinensis TaxID=1130410 RepID=A0ABR1XX98_9PEZI